MNVLNLDYFFYLYNGRRRINSLPIEKIIVIDECYKKFSDSSLEEFTYIGLNNHHIIELCLPEIEKYEGTLEGFHIIELSEIYLIKEIVDLVNSYDLSNTTFLKDYAIYDIPEKVISTYKEIGLSNTSFFADGFYLLKEHEL